MPDKITDLSYVDYCRMGGMRPSTLKHGCRSMLRLKRAMDGECQPDPQNVIVGNAAHCKIAGEFEQRYQVMPAFELYDENTTKTGKPSKSKSTEFYRDSCEVWRETTLINGVEEITEAQAATADKVARRVRSKFSRLINSSEQEVVLTGEIEGVEIKTRLDGLIADKGVVWDLKTTADCEDFAFYRVFKRLGYGFSAAVHCELLRQNGITVVDYTVLAAETQNDYDTRAITVPMLYIEQCFATVKRVAGEYARAKLHDKWPGLSDAPLAIPDYDLIKDQIEWGDEDE